MNFALGFRSQKQFFAELISPGGPNHQKKFLRIFWKFKNFEVLKLCEILRWVSGLKGNFLLTSSHLLGLIIKKKFEKIFWKFKNFEVLKLCEILRWISGLKGSFLLN